MAGIASGIAGRGRHRIALAVDKNPQAARDHCGRGRVHRPESISARYRLISRPVDGDAAGLARAESHLASQHRLQLIGDQTICARHRRRHGVDQHRDAPLAGVARGVAGRGRHHITLAVPKNAQAAGDHRRGGRVHRPETASGWRCLVGGPVDGHANRFARAETRTARQHRFELIGDDRINDWRCRRRGVDQHRGAPLAGVASGIPGRGCHRIALTIHKIRQAAGEHHGCGGVHRPETARTWRQLVGRPVDGDAAGLARAESRLTSQHRLQLIRGQGIHSRRRRGRDINR